MSSRISEEYAKSHRFALPGQHGHLPLLEGARALTKGVFVQLGQKAWARTRKKPGRNKSGFPWVSQEASGSDLVLKTLFLINFIHKKWKHPYRPKDIG